MSLPSRPIAAVGSQDRMSASPVNNLLVFASILLAGLMLYASGFTVPPYGDDFMVYFPPVSFNVLTPFVSDNPQTGFYRPIADSYHVLIQSLAGMQGWPVHVTHWLLHSLLCFLIYLGAMRFGFSRMQAFLGAGFMLVSQANGHAVFSYDTISQVLACLFGYLGVYYLIKANERRLQNDASGARSAYLISLLTYTLALFSKETGIGFFFVSGAFLLLAPHEKSDLSISERVRWTLQRFVPFIVILVMFVAVRSQLASMQPDFGGDPTYGFNLGSNVVKNLGMLGFAALSPVSTVDVFVASAERGMSILLVIFLGLTTLFAIIVGHGLWRSKLPVHPLLLVVAAGLSLTPVYLLNKVSELYVYNAMPIVSLLVGAAFGVLLMRAQGSRTRTAVVVATVVALSAVNIWSSQRKVAQMKSSASKSAIVVKEVVGFAREVPKGGSLVFLDRPVEGQVYYSVFLMHGLQLVRWAHPLIKYLSGRDDISVHRVLDGRVEPPLHGGPTVVLKMCEDGIHVCREATDDR